MGVNRAFEFEKLRISIKRALQTRDLSQEVISLRDQLRDKFVCVNTLGVVFFSEKISSGFG